MKLQCSYTKNNYVELEGKLLSSTGFLNDRMPDCHQGTSAWIPLHAHDVTPKYIGTPLRLRDQE